MLKSFLGNLVLLAAFFIPTSFFAVETACGQSLREPSLVGVTYSELAEWEAMYGGRRFYGGGYYPDFYGPSPIGYLCHPEQPYSSKNPTKKRRESPK